MAEKRTVSVLPELTAPPADAGADSGDNLLRRVNPLVILVGMGMATLFAWFLSGGGGGGGGGGDGRRPTQLPEFGLGEEVGGQLITGIRTQWEYEVDDQAGWLEEEVL